MAFHPVFIVSFIVCGIWKFYKNYEFRNSIDNNEYEFPLVIPTSSEATSGAFSDQVKDWFLFMTVYWKDISSNIFGPIVQKLILKFFFMRDYAQNDFVDLKDHNKNTSGIFWQGIYLLLVFIFIFEMALQQVQSTRELVGNNFIF